MGRSNEQSAKEIVQLKDELSQLHQLTPEEADLLFQAMRALVSLTQESVGSQEYAKVADHYDRLVERMSKKTMVALADFQTKEKEAWQNAALQSIDKIEVIGEGITFTVSPRGNVVIQAALPHDGSVTLTLPIDMSKMILATRHKTTTDNDLSCILVERFRRMLIMEAAAWQLAREDPKVGAIVHGCIVDGFEGYASLIKGLVESMQIWNAQATLRKETLPRN